MAKDGYYLQYVKEGEHTGTHYSAPCHFHVRALCADELAPGDYILPAVVVDVRDEAQANVDYHVSVADLQDWVAANGPMPQDAAVLAVDRMRRVLGSDRGPGRSATTRAARQGGFRQPGFSLASVRWLIDQGVLGERGLLGTDTFGPDPGSRLQVPGNVADAPPPPVHAREPDEPRSVADDRVLDRLGRSEERQRVGRALDGLRLDP